MAASSGSKRPRDRPGAWASSAPANTISPNVIRAGHGDRGAGGGATASVATSFGITERTR